MARKSAASSQYHKENLRRDLIEAALKYVAEHGHDTLSVRTLANIVGVSSGAPYHHFADRRSLLLALALEGYERLIGPTAEQFQAASNPMESLTTTSHQFLTFAIRNPRLFELMYESELTRPELDPAIRQAQFRGFSLLKDSIVAAVPSMTEEDFSFRLLAIWSTLYGFATLRNKQMVKPYEMDQQAADAVVKYIVKIALAGN
ncbi:TetR/AcrR family transcriptional regulator [Nitrospirillum sp. BR 11164]|uniref:TetR/AcrR family transcriptional regulator n=1 Tax=Nitrospirillum sp. BR 11164 TaxID=3104324 RepID=UPI002AFF98C6|nr:TetR/AcrR family transcriptional regulator [Nitrospirillum sp. BR 11164]MEA1648502.1 TetR/AcrR family transcriptional regulator [Nitrospirillum sp. BR 11164]